MIPIQKVKDIVVKYELLEKELSTGTIDPKSMQINRKNTQIRKHY